MRISLIFCRCSQRKKHSGRTSQNARHTQSPVRGARVISVVLDLAVPFWGQVGASLIDLWIHRNKKHSGHPSQNARRTWRPVRGARAISVVLWGHRPTRPFLADVSLSSHFSLQKIAAISKKVVENFIDLWTVCRCIATQETQRTHLSKCAAHTKSRAGCAGDFCCFRHCGHRRGEVLHS